MRCLFSHRALGRVTLAICVALFASPAMAQKGNGKETVENSDSNRSGPTLHGSVVAISSKVA